MSLSWNPKTRSNQPGFWLQPTCAISIPGMCFVKWSHRSFPDKVLLISMYSWLAWSIQTPKRDRFIFNNYKSLSPLSSGKFYYTENMFQLAQSKTDRTTVYSLLKQHIHTFSTYWQTSGITEATHDAHMTAHHQTHILGEGMNKMKNGWSWVRCSSHHQTLRPRRDTHTHTPHTSPAHRTPEDPQAIHFNERQCTKRHKLRHQQKQHIVCRALRSHDLQGQRPRREQNTQLRLEASKQKC